MANIPVDHISLQEAYSRFLAEYDADEVRFTNEPVYKLGNDIDHPFSRHLADYKWQEWNKITHAVHDDSIEDLKRAFERGELTALYEKDDSTGLYKVEARQWIEFFNMERAFYSDTFGLFYNEFAGSDLFNVTPFVHETTFDKWMEWRFPETETSTYHQHHDTAQATVLVSAASEPVTNSSDSNAGALQSACLAVYENLKDSSEVLAIFAKAYGELYPDRPPVKPKSNAVLKAVSDHVAVELNGRKFKPSTRDRMYEEIHKAGGPSFKRMRT
jgi:hypothetical protein